jgi:hypothetical protein
MRRLWGSISVGDDRGGSPEAAAEPPPGSASGGRRLALAYPDGDFDLVVLSNMIRSSRAARVVASGGRSSVFLEGTETPIYVSRAVAPGPVVAASRNCGVSAEPATALRAKG